MDFKYAIHPKHYNIGRLEKFYTDMAAKGWHLHKHGQIFSEFIKGQPMDMKYRVEVLNPTKAGWLTMSEEQKAVFEDCGWEYVDGISYISVLRAPADSDTEEFYIDPAHQAETLQGLRRLVKSNAMYWPLYILFLCIVHIFSSVDIMAYAHLTWLKEPAIIIGAAVIILGYTVDGIVGTVQINKLYKQLKRGEPVDHSPNKNGRKFAIIVFSVIVLGIIMMFTSAVLQPNEQISDGSNGGYITLTDLGVDICTTDGSHTRYVNYSHMKSPFCDYWSTDEEISRVNEWLPVVEIEQQVYLLKNKKHTEKTAKALMNTADLGESEENFKELYVSGFDKVYLYSDKEIVVVKDNYVGIFSGDFAEDSRNVLFIILREKWA